MIKTRATREFIEIYDDGEEEKIFIGQNNAIMSTIQELELVIEELKTYLSKELMDDT